MLYINEWGAIIRECGATRWIIAVTGRANAFRFSRKYDSGPVVIIPRGLAAFFRRISMERKAFKHIHTKVAKIPSHQGLPP